jgi:hypothetical protein
VIAGVWYAGRVRSSVSIALFFLLSGFFLAALLGAVERSRKLLSVAGACLVVLACIIVFLKPVQLPPARQLIFGTSSTTSTTAEDEPGPTGAATTGAAGSAGASATGTTGAPGAAGATGTTTTAP